MLRVSDAARHTELHPGGGTTPDPEIVAAGGNHGPFKRADPEILVVQFHECHGLVTPQFTSAPESTGNNAHRAVPSEHDTTSLEVGYLGEFDLPADIPLTRIDLELFDDLGGPPGHRASGPFVEAPL